MGEKITDTQVADLLVLLRTDASVDTKVAQIDNIKSGIKKNNVPDACVPSLFEITRLSMTSQHAALVNAGFSTLTHLLTRLSRQEPKHITKEAARTLPLVVEKLGDLKEKYRILAAQCLTTFWKSSPMEVERVVRNSAMTGKNSRAKEASMRWLVQVQDLNHTTIRVKMLIMRRIRCTMNMDSSLEDLSRH
jgi:CLIP-associating protein 1/2